MPFPPPKEYYLYIIDYRVFIFDDTSIQKAEQLQNKRQAMPEYAQHGTKRYFQISFIDRETYEAIDYSSFAYKIYIL